MDSLSAHFCAMQFSEYLPLPLHRIKKCTSLSKGNRLQHFRGSSLAHSLCPGLKVVEFPLYCPTMLPQQSVQPQYLYPCHPANIFSWHGRLSSRPARDCSRWYDHCHASDSGARKEKWVGMRVHAKHLLQLGKDPPVSGYYEEARKAGRPDFHGSISTIAVILL